MCLAQVVKVDKILHISKSDKFRSKKNWQEAWYQTIKRANHELCDIVQYSLTRLDHAFYVACRSFVDRWTFNRASGLNLTRYNTESNEAFIDRVWDGLNIIGDQSLGEWWSNVSDLIHGVVKISAESEASNGKNASNPSSETIALEFSKLKIGYPRSFATQAFIDLCFRVVYHVSRQFVSSALVLCDVSQPFAQQIVSETPHIIETSNFDWKVLERILLPTDVISNYFPTSIEQEYSAYYKEVIIESSAIELMAVGYLDYDIAAALVYHRSKDLRKGVQNFHKEQKIVKDSSMEYFISSIFRYSTISELSIIVGREIGGQAGHSLNYAGFALNSAWRVWLDDSDLNIAICRTVLEQVARARAFRLKPEKALKQSSQIYQPPSRWIEIGGLKRLSALNEALGDFCHYRHEDARPVARETLIEVQGEDVDYPAFTARTNLLLNTAYALATELSEILNKKYRRLAKCFEDEVSLVSIEGKRRGFEEFLNDCQKLKNR